MGKKQYTKSEKENVLRYGKEIHKYVEADNGGNWLSEVTVTYVTVIKFENKFYWVVYRGTKWNATIKEFEEIR